MLSTAISLPAIENAIHEVCLALKDKGREPPLWPTISEYNLWRELVACVLGSRVRFEVAHSAIKQIERRGLLCASKRSSRFEQYEMDVRKALSETDEQNDVGRYPFFRIRANQIRWAAERLFGRYGGVRAFLEKSRDFRDTRRRLASEVPGLGPKQASLFLRNIGYTREIAVLDIHVLTYLNWAGLIEAPMNSVPTIRKYEAIENGFIERSYSLGHAPDHFDLAVWIVVRVLKEEQRRWD